MFPLLCLAYPRRDLPAAAVCIDNEANILATVVIRTVSVWEFGRKMSRIVCLLLCVLCAEVAVAQGWRERRATGGSSSSSSSSGSGSYSSGGTGSGGVGSSFMFPSNNFGYPGFGAPPFPDFNILFQQFLSSLQAHQAYAAQNPHYAPIFNQQLASLMAQQQAAMAQYPLLFPGVDSNTISPDVRTSGANNVYTGASVNYGPQGGYGQAASFPGGADGLGVRIAEELPPPNGGGSFGVFTSSSSGTSDVNGKRTSFKTSTFGTNDNGKITFRTINE